MAQVGNSCRDGSRVGVWLESNFRGVLDLVRDQYIKICRQNKTDLATKFNEYSVGKSYVSFWHNYEKLHVICYV